MHGQWVVKPSDDNPFYQEWAWLYWQQQTDWSAIRQDAIDSLTRVIEFQYPRERSGCIIGDFICRFHSMIYDYGAEDIAA